MSIHDQPAAHAWPWLQSCIIAQVDGVRIYHDQALNKEPGGGYTPWHCDGYYWPLQSDKILTAWVPLQVCCHENDATSSTPRHAPCIRAITATAYKQHSSKARTSCQRSAESRLQELSSAEGGDFPDILGSAEGGEHAVMWQYHLPSDTPFCDVQAVPEDMGPLQFAAGSQRYDLGRCCLVKRHHSKCMHAHTEFTLLTAYKVDAVVIFASVCGMQVDQAIIDIDLCCDPANANVLKFTAGARQIVNALSLLVRSQCCAQHQARKSWRDRSHCTGSVTSSNLYCCLTGTWALEERHTSRLTPE